MLFRSAQVFDQPQHDYTKHLLDAEPSGEPIELDKDANVILACKNVSVKFPLNKGFFFVNKFLTAVDNVFFEVRTGQTLGIVGESGSGKTTLGLSLLRLIKSRGKIVFKGTNQIGRASCRERV